MNEIEHQELLKKDLIIHLKMNAEIKRVVAWETNEKLISKRWVADELEFPKDKFHAFLVIIPRPKYRCRNYRCQNKA